MLAAAERTGADAIENKTVMWVDEHGRQVGAAKKNCPDRSILGRVDEKTRRKLINYTIRPLPSITRLG